MSTFQFHGYNVWYNESGEGGPLIFLHNGGNDHRIWDHQVNHFSATRRVIVLDHLGFGNSDRPSLDYTLPLYSEQVKSLIEHLNVDKATLAGHCIGAAMSLHYAVRHPETVERLILFNTATERTLCAGPLRQAYQTFSLIWGEDNELLPLTGGKEFARELRPDRFEILAACGHMTTREQPGRVNALIESFLSAPGG